MQQTQYQLNAEEKIATRDAFGKEIAALAEKNEDIVVLDADLGGSTKIRNVQKVVPERYFSIGISEQDMVSMAAGLALSGKIPVISSFTSFLGTRAFDQVRVSVAYSCTNVKMVASHAGILTGPDGPTAHGLEDVALMRSLPNISIIVPADGTETKLATRAMVNHKGAVYLRTNRPSTPLLFDDSFEFEIGKAYLMQEGKDVGIIAAGAEVLEALKAADKLKEKGISASVMNCSSIKPLDTKAITELAKNCGAIVTAEDHRKIGGLGAAVAETLVENYPVPMERVGIGDKFTTSGNPEELQKLYGLDSLGIAGKAEDVIKRK